MDTDGKLQNHSFPFEPGVLEIQNESDAKLGNAKGVQHLTTLVVGDSVNHLGVHDDSVEGDQIWNELADLDATKKHWESPLLVKWDRGQLERDRHRGLVNLLVKAVANLVQDVKGAAEDSMRFLLEQEFRVLATGQVGS